MTASEKQQMQNIVALVVVAIVNTQLFLFQAENLFTFKKYGLFVHSVQLTMHYSFIAYSFITVHPNYILNELRGAHYFMLWGIK